jgi:hypothetical protein
VSTAAACIASSPEPVTLGGSLEASSTSLPGPETGVFGV